MSVFTPTADRVLDLADLLKELVAQGRIDQDAAEQCLAIRRSAVNNQQHPLEFLASQELDDLKRPGRKLDLESLTAWLAEWSRQPYLRIDPLKIDVAAVTPLMSYAFAQRHGILAVAVERDSVTIASASASGRAHTRMFSPVPGRPPPAAPRTRTMASSTERILPGEA